MLYNEEKAALTKERLEDLRRERKLSFEQLSKKLDERGTKISHTNLKNYEINDFNHPLYGRTKSMGIEYLVALADFYDVSVDYLLGLSPSRKHEHHDIAEQLGLCDEAIEALIECKKQSEMPLPIYTEQYTAILNDLLTSSNFNYVLQRIQQSLMAYMMFRLAHKTPTQVLREQNKEAIDNAANIIRRYGYSPVEDDLLSEVFMERAIGEITCYLRAMPERMYEEFQESIAHKN